MDIFTNPQKYTKFYVALMAALGVLVVACSPTDKEAAFVVTSTEWYQVLFAFAGALGVVSFPNKD
jgi:membrane associated rhomboid family serine protease